MNQVIGSIVTFNPNWELLEKTIRTFLAGTDNALIVVWDNSPADLISSRLAEFGEQVRYHLSPGNFGYGKGNNQVFQRYHEQADFFCVLNPDLEIPRPSMPALLDFMRHHPQWGLVVGSICSPQGTTDPVHKLLPSFLRYAVDFACRKFLGVQIDKETNLVFLKLGEKPSRLPILSGCFMLFTGEHYKELGGFDERFFLYFEDWDVSLRSFLLGKSLILPQVRIQHSWGRQSHKKMAIFLIHLRSAFTFYRKWGFRARLPNLVNKHSGFWDPQVSAPNLMKEL